MARLRYNFVDGGTLNAPLTASGATITFESIPPFDTITGLDYIPLVLDPLSNNPEIVYLTAFTQGAQTGTISRGEEGTTGRIHPAGARWGHFATVTDFENTGSEAYDDEGNVSGAVTLSLPEERDALISRLRLTGNITSLTINGLTSGRAQTVTMLLIQDGTGSRTIAWPASFKWHMGIPFVLSTAANAIDIVSAMTIDGGTTWFAFPVGAQFA